MKKLLSISLICLFAFPAFSQERWTKKAPRRGADAREKHTIVSAYGAAFGLTYGKQIWDPEGPLAQERYMLSWNAAGLVEFFRHTHYRWRMELEYNKMGTKELYYPPSSALVVNKTNYIQFNNYLKIIYKEYKVIPYLLIGPRVEYLFVRKASVYPEIIGQFHSFQVTASVGAGFEIAWNHALRPFMEGFYNHDILPSLQTVASPSQPILTTINYHAWELRIGLKYFIAKGKGDACPPVDNPAGN